jgi:hypothetical protein
MHSGTSIGVADLSRMKPNRDGSEPTASEISLVPQPTTQESSAFPQEYLGRLVGLAVACPVGKDNPTDCPLHELRRLPMVERFEWSRAQTIEEAVTLWARHTSCPRLH